MKRNFFSKPGHLILFSLFVLNSFACQSGVKVLFKNESIEDFKELKVNIKGQEFRFFDLKRGEITKPVRVPGSYRYCYAQVITSRDTITCQPIDYVGETLYTTGRLTMTLVIEGDGKDRSLNIR